MALKMTLKPGEKFVVNGAVIVNGERRAHLLMQNNVAILREKDVMQQEDANTPVKRIYFAIQMLYLDETSREEHFEQYSARLKEFMEAVKDPDILDKCASILGDVENRHYYRALLTCRKMIPFEKSRLEYNAEDDGDDVPSLEDLGIKSEVP